MTIEADMVSVKSGKNDTETRVWSHKGQDFFKYEEKYIGFQWGTKLSLTANLVLN
jgi:hypothetical protein